MNKLQRSWNLLKASFRVITFNKQLMIFPIVSFSMTVVVVLFFLAPAALRPTGYSYSQAEHWEAIGHSLFTQASNAESPNHSTIGVTPWAAVYLALTYLVAMFIATFFNVAFYNEILAALSGQPVSIGRGLKFALSRWKPILMWTLLAGVVGLIIKAIEQRLELFGRLLARLLGAGWSIASVFVIPIMVREEPSANAVALLRKSATLLKRTWGEALIGYVGLAFANGMVLLVSLIFLVGAMFASIALNNFWWLAAAGVLWFVGVFTWSYISGVASQVYKGALYLYAAEGTIPAPYNQEMLDSAWKLKKS